MVNWSPLVQAEPAPVTVTAPLLPALMARNASPPLETAPPAAIVSVPEPNKPTFTLELVVKLEPAPVTITALVVAGVLAVLAMKRPVGPQVTVPPCSIVSVPVPKSPTNTEPVVVQV